MSRSIDDLRPWFQPKVRAFIEQAKAQGIPLKITRTATTEPVQAALYAIGRRPLTEGEEVILKVEGLYPASQEKTVTNAAHASDTPHGTLLAFDCVPIADTGKLWYDAPKKIWNALYIIAERCGLDALGDSWGQFLSKDKGHFQEPGWRIVGPG